MIPMLSTHYKPTKEMTMQVDIMTRDFEHTEAIDQQIQKKLNKITKFLDGSAAIKWTCHGDKNHMVSEVRIHNKKIWMTTL